MDQSFSSLLNQTHISLPGNLSYMSGPPSVASPPPSDIQQQQTQQQQQQQPQ